MYPVSEDRVKEIKCFLTSSIYAISFSSGEQWMAALGADLAAADTADERKIVHGQPEGMGLMKQPQVVAPSYSSCSCLCCWQVRKYSGAEPQDTYKLLLAHMFLLSQ